ncbi:MAG: polysaccharide lyase [Adhaeribacter sp.]
MKNLMTFSACLVLATGSLLLPQLETRHLGRLLPGLAFRPGQSTDGLIFSENFEGPAPFAAAANTDLVAPYSFQVVDSPVYKGSKAGRFELRDTDPMIRKGTRAEVTIVKEGVQKEMWYAFAVYFPSDEFVADSKTEIICQWWQSGDNHLGESNASPATALRIKQDRFIFDTGYNDALISKGVLPQSRRKIDLGPVVKNCWQEFVFHFIHSYQSDGLIEVWQNGARVLTHRGGNMYNNAVLPKWKLGIYKWKWNGEESSDTPKRVLYFDNIRVGNALARAGEMNPVPRN